MNLWKLLSNQIVSWALVALAAMVMGCLDVRDDSREEGADDEGCEICHRFSDGSPSHAAHISGEMMLSGPVQCSECHPTDNVWLESGHMNGEVELGFETAVLAKKDNMAPAWNGNTCENVYCHGGSLSGGTNVNPTWNEPSEQLCGTCHGIPPTENHINSLNCEGCHAKSYTDGQLNENHVNGILDFVTKN